MRRTLSAGMRVPYFKSLVLTHGALFFSRLSVFIFLELFFDCFN